MSEKPYVSPCNAMLNSANMYTIHPEDALTVDQLNRIVVSPDGRRIAFHEPESGRLFRAWRSGGKNGWIRLAVADAILSGRHLSILDVCERAVASYRETNLDCRHVVVEVRE